MANINTDILTFVEKTGNTNSSYECLEENEVIWNKTQNRVSTIFSALSITYEVKVNNPCKIQFAKRHRLQS